MPEETSKPAPPAGEQISRICFSLGALGLIFLLGGVIAHSSPGYSRLLKDAIQAMGAYGDQRQAVAQRYHVCLWYPESKHQRGLLKHDTSKSFPGFTLCLSGEGGVAYLIDNDGKEVHRWDAPFNAVWPNPTQTKGETPDYSAHIRRGHVYPNGDLLAQYESPVQTPYGVGIAKLDRDSRVLWTYDANTHHDFSVTDDGRIYALTHEIRSTPLSPEWARVKLPVVEEFVVELSPEGKELHQWSLFDLMGKSQFHRWDTTNSTHFGDVMHSNTVNIIGPEFASHYPEVEAGDLMICLRNIGQVVIMSPKKAQIVWATSGPWGFPHDPDPLPNGNIMIFDNCYARGTLDGSRVVEFDPRGMGTIVWHYAGTEEEPFRSTIRSVQQQLPNGNILATESDHGRLIEVDRSGEIVWEYVNPARDGENGTKVAIYCGGRRYTPQEVSFLVPEEIASRPANNREN